MIDKNTFSFRLTLLSAILLTLSLLLSACSESASPPISTPARPEPSLSASATSATANTSAATTTAPATGATPTSAPAGTVTSGPTTGTGQTGGVGLNAVPARAWIVTDSGAVLKAFLQTPADPLKAVPPPPATDALKAWDKPLEAWLELEMGAIKVTNTAPTRASRFLALLSVGMSDGLLVADQGQAQGLKISRDALLAEIATSMITYAHDATGETMLNHKAIAVWVGAWQGREGSAEVEAGLRLGRLVAQKMLDHAHQDGADELPRWGEKAGDEPVAPGKWESTAPYYRLSLDPEWSKLALLGIQSDPAWKLPSPPDWNSPEFEQERKLFRETQQKLTPADIALAKKWAGGERTVTPAGLWFQIAEEVLGKANPALTARAQVYAAMGVTMQNTLCVVWKNKYEYMEVRPITWMNTVDPAWKPVVFTPPFPSYPSGHATISAAAAQVLSLYLPQERARFEQEAKDAAYSRLLGGIHWDLDNRRGAELGSRIGEQMIRQLQSPRS